MGKLKVGVIGTGGMSRVHGKQFKELEEWVTIEAIADPSEAQQQLFIQECKVQPKHCFSDYQDMLAEIELDAVVICSPHTLHYQQAKEALQSGLHVLLEKPMVCSSSQCRELIQLANESNLILQVSYQRHFQPDFLYIKECIQNGTIGRLTSVNAALYQDWHLLTENTWRQNPTLSGGGMLMDSGSHIIDVLLWVTGQEVTDLSSRIDQRGYPVEINSMTQLVFSDGAMGSLTIIGDSPCWHETYVFGGEKGAIFYDNGEVTLRLHGEAPIKPQLPEKTTNQDKSFVDAILGIKTEIVRGEFALKVIQLTERIYANVSYVPLKS